MSDTAPTSESKRIKTPEHHWPDTQDVASDVLKLAAASNVIQFRGDHIDQDAMVGEELAALLKRRWSVNELIHELLESPDLRSKLKRIKASGHAAIYKAITTDEVELAIKITKPVPGYTSIFSGALVDPRFMRYFYKRFLLTGLSPHFAVHVDSAHTIGHTHGVSLIEYAKFGHLNNYFFEMSSKPEVLLLHTRMLLFQVVFTFAKIQQLHPLFRHNDMKIDNVLVGDAPTEGQACYHDSDAEFYLANLGFRAIVYDFDLASILAATESLEVHEWAVNEPARGMGVGENCGADLYVFARNISFYIGYCLKDFDTTPLGIAMSAVWGPGIHSRTHYKVTPMFRPPLKGELPSAAAVLHSDLFAEFRRPALAAPVTQHYGIDRVLRGEDDSFEELVRLPDFKEHHAHMVGVLNVETCFGTTKREGTLFSLDAVKSYDAARGVRDTRFGTHQLVSFGDAEFVKLRVGAAAWLSDMLEPAREQDNELVEAIIDSGLAKMSQAVDYLGCVRGCFVKLIAAFAAMSTCKTATRIIGQKDFITLLAERSGGLFKVPEVEAAYLQYRWTLHAMQLDNYDPERENAEEKTPSDAAVQKPEEAEAKPAEEKTPSDAAVQKTEESERVTTETDSN